MLRQEVRSIYSDQYVLLEILGSWVPIPKITSNTLTRLLLFEPFNDPSEATKELIMCKDNHIVYHCSLAIDRSVIDTGAAHSLISSDIVWRKSASTLKMAIGLSAALGLTCREWKCTLPPYRQSKEGAGLRRGSAPSTLLRP